MKTWRALLTGSMFVSCVSLGLAQGPTLVAPLSGPPTSEVAPPGAPSVEAPITEMAAPVRQPAAVVPPSAPGQYVYPVNPSQMAPNYTYPQNDVQSLPGHSYTYPQNTAEPTDGTYTYEAYAQQQSSYYSYDQGFGYNAGAHLAPPPPLGLIQPEAYAGGLHERFPYYSYRRPWYYPGPASLNVTIVW